MNTKTFLITVIITVFSSACSKPEVETSPLTSVEPLVVQCDQQLPGFTLGPHSSPSKEELDQLCSCVWNTLEGWEREASIALAEGREKEMAAMHLRGFPNRFGSVIDACGGMEL